MSALYQLQIAIAEHLKSNPADLGHVIGAAVAGMSNAIDESNRRANRQGDIANLALILLDSKRMTATNRAEIYQMMVRAIGDGDTTAIQNKFKGASA